MMKPVTDPTEYLIKGYLDWVANNEHLVKAHVVCHLDKVKAAPTLDHLAADGFIHFSFAPNALRNLIIDSQGISFEGRFAGVPTRVFFQYEAVHAMLAFDTDNHPRMPIGFSVPNDAEQVSDYPVGQEPPVRLGKPNLTLVK